MTESLFIRMYRNSVTPEQYIAMCELEARGFRFCTHFGYGNAIERLGALNEAEAEGAEALYDYVVAVMGAV